MARPKLRATEEQPDLRRELRAALREQKAAHGAIGNQKAAISRMLSQIAEAEAAIPALEKRLKGAEKAHIDAVAAAAVAGAEAPASTVVPEALASLAFGRDRVETLRAARRQVEQDLPGYEEEVLEVEVKVENLISQIIADHIEVVILEATELAKRLAPYKAALMSFVNDHSNSRPTEWHLQRPHAKARAPLDEVANLTFAFFRSLREAELPHINNPWRKIREDLRQNPDGPVLRPLVAAFGGLLDKSADKTPDEHPGAST
jgi:hypothetical protein